MIGSQDDAQADYPSQGKSAGIRSKPEIITGRSLNSQKETAMGREVRMVPPDWQHPEEDGDYKPLFDGADFARRLAEWEEGAAKWASGEFPDYADDEDRKLSYEEWDGEEPQQCDYMPQWPAEQRTHYMMYETTSEGTPISPAFATPEELARWLADTGASAFGSSTASYEGWLRVAKGGYAPSAVSIGGGPLISGVDAAL